MHSKRHRLTRHLPLLAGELVVASAALAALTLAIDEPLYEGLVHTAVVLGLVASALGFIGRGVWSTVGLVVAVTALILRLGHPVLPGSMAFFPPETAANDDLFLAALVGWFMVAFSFWHARRTNLIFMIVCGLAIFGLVGTVNLNSETLVSFAVFLCGAVFCWGYEQFLDMQERLEAAGQPASAGWRDMARGQLSVAVLVGLLTFTLGSALGAGAYRASPNLYAKMTERAYGWSFSRGIPGIFNSFRSNFRVGPGPVKLSEVEVMRVQADHASLWRGVAYDHYDGHVWSRTARGADRLISSGSDYAVPERYVPPARAWRVNVQRVMVSRPDDVLFAAAQPIAVRLPDVASPPQRPALTSPVVDPYGCLSWPFGASGSLDEYWVSSREPISDPVALRGAFANYASTSFEPYLQVPAITQAALQPLVTRLTDGLTTPYDKVVALEKYIESTCLYTLNAPAAPRSARQDAVDWFLNQSQRGACDLFSSSLAVMARMAGVPARVATGYATGEYDHESRSFIVRGRDAHAWTEVYFHGHGWVPFDPQARQRYEDESLAKLLTGEHWRIGLREVAHDAVMLAIMAVIALVALAAFVDPVHLLRRLFVRRAQSPLSRLSAEYRNFYMLLLRKCDLPMSKGLTPHEAVVAIADAPCRLPLDRRRLLTLNERFYYLRYSDDATFKELGELREELQSLRRQLRRHR